MKLVCTFLIVVFLLALGPWDSANATEEGLGLKRIGIGIGLINHGVANGAVIYKVQADLGKLVPKLSLVTSLLYWRYTQSASDALPGCGPPGSYCFEGSPSRTYSDLGVSSGVKYSNPLTEKLDLYVTGELGIYVADPGSSALGFSIFGGIQYPLSERIGAFAELGHKEVFSEFNGFDMQPLVLGISFKLDQ